MEVSNGAVLEVSEERKARALFHIETHSPEPRCLLTTGITALLGANPASPGIHQVRVSKDRYQHSNTVLKSRPLKKGNAKW